MPVTERRGQNANRSEKDRRVEPAVRTTCFDFGVVKVAEVKRVDLGDRHILIYTLQHTLGLPVCR